MIVRNGCYSLCEVYEHEHYNDIFFETNYGDPSTVPYQKVWVSSFFRPYLLWLCLVSFIAFMWPCVLLSILKGFSHEAFIIVCGDEHKPFPFGGNRRIYVYLLVCFLACYYFRFRHSFFEYLMW